MALSPYETTPQPAWVPSSTSSKPSSKPSCTNLEILHRLASSTVCHIFDILRHVLRSSCAGLPLPLLPLSVASALRRFAAAASKGRCEIIQDWELRGDKPDITLLLFVGDTLRSFQSNDPDMYVLLPGVTGRGSSAMDSALRSRKLLDRPRLLQV